MVLRNRNIELINELKTALQSASTSIKCLEKLQDRLLTSSNELQKVNREIESLIVDVDLMVDFEDDGGL